MCQKIISLIKQINLVRRTKMVMRLILYVAYSIWDSRAWWNKLKWWVPNWIVKSTNWDDRLFTKVEMVQSCPPFPIHDSLFLYQTNIMNKQQTLDGAFFASHSPTLSPPTNHSFFFSPSFLHSFGDKQIPIIPLS